MMPFDHVFEDVARRESRAIQTVDPAGKQATFLFRELFCHDPGCDCRRVLLCVHWIEEQRIAATINYAFEPSRRRDEPQFTLDPLNPQSEHADSLLAVFVDMIAKDVAYRKQLIRHYEMWKQVVDNPAHPDHAKVRGKEHDDPSFRPAFPAPKAKARRRGPRADRAGSQHLELVVAKATRADGKLRQRFRRLLGKVELLRQRVHAWKEQRPNIDRELAMYDAVFGERCRLGREMVNLLDRSYLNPALTKADRKKLTEVIVATAGQLLEEGEHDDLKAIYNRYSRSDFDAEVVAADAASVDAMKAMMEMFGVEFGDAEVDTMEKLQAFAAAEIDAVERDAAAARERQAKRKKSAKQLAAEARRADEQRGADKAVQEVYRALALALHPDRERDPKEQARKAEVMREVNIAYEAKDLLRLLELQLQLEGVDAARADAFAEERVRQFIRILDEQSSQLAIELEKLELPYRLQLELSPRSDLTPADVVAQIKADTEIVRQNVDALAGDLEAFDDIRRLKAWLNARPQARGRGRMREADLFA